ncbi:MAG: VCBS repeat-containing protein [Planctomycetes bacterium]|nr:VCBS repeat-containing protein [Planctomycetota bacterium]
MPTPAAPRREHRSLAALAAPLAVLLAFAAAPATAAAEDLRDRVEFTGIRVYAAQPILEIECRDLNADGLLDLILQEGRQIQVFLFERDKGIPIDPQARIELPTGAFLYDLGDLNPTTGFGIAYLMSDGAYFVPYAHGAFQVESLQLIELPTFFSGESTEPPVRVEFMKDLNADRRADLVLPQIDAFAVLTQDASGEFRINQRIPITPDVRVEAGGWSFQDGLKTSIALPNFFVTDANGDGRPDLVLFQGDNFSVFRQDADGHFPPTPSADVVINVEGAHKRKQRVFSFEIPPEVRDLNGDAMADALVTYASRGVTALFLGRQEGPPPAAPDQLLKVDGYVYRMPGWVADLDGDGHLDLVSVEAKKMGVWSALQVIMTRTIDVDLTVNLWSAAEGKFAAEAAFRKEITVPFVISVTNRTISVDFPFLINFAGDYNADGLRDFLVKTDLSTLTVYYGAKSGVFEEKPGMRISTTDTSAYTGAVPHIHDLNGDGISDIVLLHHDIEDRHNALEILLSRRK